MRALPEVHSWLETLRIPLATGPERGVMPRVEDVGKEEPTELV